MSRFFARNIDREGRVARAWTAVFLLLGAVASAVWGSIWAAAVLAFAGLFTLFEALRGWCLLRACGIKTKR